MSGEITNRNITNNSRTNQVSDRMIQSMSSSPSPLKIFGNAKKRIRDIFVDVSKYIEETSAFMNGVDDDRIVEASGKVQINGYIDTVQGIRDVLSRDHMKVVFFGRTSNGKSTTINSMLRSKILPSGIGHTTHCFVQVEGTDSPEGYLLTEGSDERKNVNSLADLANALSKVKLKENSLITICWPKNKCSLLKDDVVLVDSPGIDVSPNLDSWIDKFCLDADVFVLVANAESTLMQTEKNFFLKVSDRLSKPTVFILNNRWDASASEPDMVEQVKSQHMERNVEFLCNELKVVSAKEAEDRIFFVSAKEALHQRLTEKGVSTTPCSVLDGYQSRLFEFSSFERQFEECISRSAVKTKFAQHAQKGKQMISELRAAMEHALDNCNTIRDELTNSRTLTSKQLIDLERQLAEISAEIEKAIQSIADDVQRKVAKALSEEIRRLYELVDEFDRPFHPDPVFIDVYKKELHKHVENGLGQKIEDRCSSALNDIVHNTDEKMIERMLSILPADHQASAQSHFTSPPAFSVEYRLDARSLCADFKEDIQFRFSYSPSALLSKYMGRQFSITALWNRPNFQEQQVLSGPPPSMPSGSSESYNPNLAGGRENAGDVTDTAVAILRLAPALASTSTITCVCIAGAISRAVGWKVFAVVGGVYGALYLYERLLWSNRAKERAFKSQYVAFANSKLRLVVDMTSANASHQVLQALTSTFSRLKHEVNRTREELEVGIRVADGEIAKLDEVSNQTRLHRNKAGWLENEVNDFISRFIEYS